MSDTGEVSWYSWGNQGSAGIWRKESSSTYISLSRKEWQLCLVHSFPVELSVIFGKIVKAKDLQSFPDPC